MGPCGICPSCIKAQTHNHPDIIRTAHEKKTVLSVQEIREQLVDTVSVAPYYGPYKIYIVEDAQLLNEHGQNALLKTIEEPPDYVLIFILTGLSPDPQVNLSAHLGGFLGGIFAGFLLNKVPEKWILHTLTNVILTVLWFAICSYCWFLAIGE